MSALPGHTLKDAIRREVVAYLCVHARGRANAITGERLAEIVGAKIPEHGLAPATLQRRTQEAVEEGIEAGEPIGSSSSPPRGYWWAEIAEDLEESLAEADGRAKKALRRRRCLKLRIRELRGQGRLLTRPVIAPPDPGPVAQPAAEPSPTPAPPLPVNMPAFPPTQLGLLGGLR
jgi:hypothetical protein